MIGIQVIHRPQLNGTRKDELVHFLKEAGLINAKNTVVSLNGAVRSFVGLSHANLSYTRLTGADLSSADLKDASLANERLVDVVSFQGATMPNGSIHP